MFPARCTSSLPLTFHGGIGDGIIVHPPHVIVVVSPPAFRCTSVLGIGFSVRALRSSSCQVRSSEFPLMIIVVLKISSSDVKAVY